MCGIVGFAGFRDHSLLMAMNERIYHRGPDGEGSFESDFASIAMRRLAIIDLKNGGQPQFSRDRKVAVVFNGEIYNFRELRSELQGKGYEFLTQSDTEVIVNGYLCWNLGFVDHLEGMFAIAIIDARSLEQPALHLIRDRFGVKPLYFRRDGAHLLFASEIKSLLCSMAESPKLHLPSLFNYLNLRYVPGPDCLIQGIQKLPAASIATFRASTLEICRYWKPVLPKSKSSLREQEALAQLDAGLDVAVRRRMVADVPVGAYLSGGLDSSIIVAKMAAISKEQICTFSIGFGHPTDELSAARQTARHLGTDHQEIIFVYDDFDQLEKIVWSLDEPLGDAIILPMFLLAREARKKVKVVLAGEGADEVFGGYLFHKAIHLVMRARKLLPGVLWDAAIASLRLLPHQILDRVFPYPGTLGESGKARLIQLLKLAREGKAGELYRLFISLFSPGEMGQIVSPSLAKHLAVWEPRGGVGGEDTLGALDRVLAQQYQDWLTDDILNNLDKMTMANSLEAREPFLDTDLFAFVASLPDASKVSGWQDKQILRLLAARLGLGRVAKRAKKPFYMPVDFFFASAAFNRLRDKALRQPGMQKLFDASFLEGQFRNSHTALEAKKTFALIMLGLWLEAFDVEVTL